MKKDKKWLLSEFRKLPCEVERGHGKVKVVDILPLIDQLDEPEKVVIPKFVADWIEEMKQDERPLYNVMSSLTNKRNHEWTIWKKANMNFSEIVAQAWLNDYEVEKEQLYYVLNKHGETLLLFYGGKVSVSSGYEIHDDNKGLYQLSEKQIKDYDERYWRFAVEVAE